MNILILGGGGREHALSWCVAQSSLVEHVFVLPGNPGTGVEMNTTNLSGDPCDAELVAQVAQANDVSLVVVGPEAPLVAGVASALRDAGVAVVGPGSDGAVLEGSKAFAKEVMIAAGVPTAAYGRVTSAAEIDAFCDGFEGEALVVKADGLAAGKGVIVCDSVEEARVASKEMLAAGTFGDASRVIVLEERLMGVETSYIVLAAGETFVALPTSQDHKRLLDGDLGPNTGGMGAYSPAPFVGPDLQKEIERDVIAPTLAELKRRGIDFRGFLYAGVMLTEAGPSVLEFNVRLGDPETQVLLSALESDLVPALLACANGDLSGVALSAGQAAAVVVLAAEGYPTSPVKGAAIEGVEAADALQGVKVFHAGTAETDGALLVNGGRVLGVTACGATPEEAVARAYDGAGRISWPGMQRRSDIGKHIL